MGDSFFSRGGGQFFTGRKHMGQSWVVVATATSINFTGFFVLFIACFSTTIPYLW